MVTRSKETKMRATSPAQLSPSLPQNDNSHSAETDFTPVQLRVRKRFEACGPERAIKTPQATQSANPRSFKSKPRKSSAGAPMNSERLRSTRTGPSGLRLHRRLELRVCRAAACRAAARTRREGVSTSTAETMVDGMRHSACRAVANGRRSRRGGDTVRELSARRRVGRREDNRRLQRLRRRRRRGGRRAGGRR